MKRKNIILLLLFFSVFVIPLKAVQVNIGDVIECSNITNNTISMNPSAFDALIQICLTSDVCTRIYGQNFIIKKGKFIALFEKTTHYQTSALFEQPLWEFVCGKTVLQILELLWINVLKVDMLDSDQVCAIDAFPVYASNKIDTTCSQTPLFDNEYKTDYDIISLTVTIMLLCSSLLMAGVGIVKTYISIRQHKYLKKFLNSIKTNQIYFLFSLKIL